METVFGGGLTLVFPLAEILKELDEHYERFKREADGAQKRSVHQPMANPIPLCDGVNDPKNLQADLLPEPK